MPTHSVFTADIVFATLFRQTARRASAARPTGFYNVVLGTGECVGAVFDRPRSMPTHSVFTADIVFATLFRQTARRASAVRPYGLQRYYRPSTGGRAQLAPGLQRSFGTDECRGGLDRPHIMPTLMLPPTSFATLFRQMARRASAARPAGLQRYYRPSRAGERARLRHNVVSGTDDSVGRLLTARDIMHSVFTADIVFATLFGKRPGGRAQLALRAYNVVLGTGE